MHNYQAQIAAQFDDPYAAQMFLDTIIKAIKKTQWDTNALPQSAINMGVFKFKLNDKGGYKKTKIITH